MDGFDFRGSEPIYVQLKERLRGFIISGIIKENEKLPSVREIALSLSVNPNTVQRAYRELEDEGYIVSIAGKGSFARKNETSYKRIKELKAAFCKAAEELLYSGIDKNELVELIGKEYDGK